MMRRLVAWSLWFAVFLSGTSWSHDVWVALSEEGGAYGETALRLREEFARTQHQVQVRVAHWQEFASESSKLPDLVITLGATAFRGLTESAQRASFRVRPPILAALLPRSSYESLPSRARQGSTAVFLDQPVSRYMDLLYLSMPGRRRVGVLLGPDSMSLAPALSKAAAQRGMQLVMAKVPADADDVYPALRSVLAEADVLLALPDNRVFNAASIQNILISTYRQRIPVVTFSPAYVKAGATLALHASPAQVANQTLALALSILAGGSLPSPQPASEFSVTANDRVARSLGLSLGEAAELSEALRRQEAGR